MLRFAIIAAAVLLSFGFASPAMSQNTATAVDTKEKTEKPVKWVAVELAGGKLNLQVPDTWKQVKPRSGLLEKEFAVGAKKDAKQAGRLTMMRAGGPVKANVDRWIGQFSQANGKPTKDVAKVTTKKVNGMEATIVDIPGTFSERMGGGPFAPGKTVVRKDYRMLGGILQTAAGQYFVKFYGPAETVKTSEKHFMKMMESFKSGK